MPYAPVRGTRLYYERQGSGPGVIVAHGALANIAFAQSYGVPTASFVKGNPTLTAERSEGSSVDSRESREVSR
jgi:hypothetical protein